MRSSEPDIAGIQR